VNDEYLPQALAAVDLVQSHPAIDPTRVFVLGHSLGGTFAPRVAEARSSVAGLIILAGGAQPLQWAVVRQLRYIAALNPSTAAASQQSIDVMSEQARAVDSSQLTVETPASTLTFGLPASYWLDLREFDPPAAAAALGRPMLILQGGRDYQATVTEDLALWQVAVGDLPDVTTRVYPADNHFFFSGAGQSTPAEYEAVQHMDRAVVDDIADWASRKR
jgi:uncharacterized protein